MSDQRRMFPANTSRVGVESGSRGMGRKEGRGRLVSRLCPSASASADGGGWRPPSALRKTGGYGLWKTRFGSEGEASAGVEM